MQGTPCTRVEEEAHHSPLGGHGWGVGRERVREVEERAEIPLAEGIARITPNMENRCGGEKHVQL